MADYLQNKTLQKVINTLRLPIPTPVILDRNNRKIPEKELAGKAIKIGYSGDPLLDLDSELQKLGASTGKQDKYHALVFDASSIQRINELELAYSFLHENIRSISRGGRVVLIASKYDDLSNLEKQSSSRALEGLQRSIAKEVGNKGITANLLYVEEALKKDQSLLSRFSTSLQFLLSNRSAFIDAQAFTISGRVLMETSENNNSLEGKVALVTGAARGIGASAARILQREGAKVVVLDVPQAENDAKSLSEVLNGDLLLLDIAEKDSAVKIRDYCKEKYGGLDILVNNAGITRDKTIAKMSADYWNKVIAVNLKAASDISSLFLEDGLNDFGRIIGLSSISGLSGNFGQTNYAASKAGMIALMEALAEKASSRGIAANAVAPGFIETKMTETMPFFMKEGGRRLSNLKQGGVPEDIGEAIGFLASPGAAGITGQVIRVCGGSMIGA